MSAILLPLLLSISLPAAPVLDAGRMVDAIEAVENWKRGTVGRAGEIGKYQILPAVWRKYSTVVQWSASAAEQRRVVLKHVAWIRDELRRNGLPDTPWFISAAYGGGLTATINRRLSAAKRDYADRAETLYNALR